MKRAWSGNWNGVENLLTAAVLTALMTLAPLSLQADDLVKSWGENANGELGNNSTVNSGLPVDLLLPAGAAKISTGYDHSFALMPDGTVWAWGDNLYGELGDGTNDDSLFPVQLATIAGVKEITAGYWFSAAVKTDGTVWAWGYGADGELGNGANNDSNVPVQVAEPLDPTGFLTGVTKVCSGYGHVIALKSDGTVWAWGWGAEGELGNGGNNNSNVAVQLLSLSGITAIASGGGGQHSLALKNDGTLYAWGYGGYGELGNGADANSNIPVVVSNLTGVDAIAGGGYHSLAVVDGIVYSWGYGIYGQLGNGSTSNSNVPVQVLNLAGVSSLSAGESHSLALLNDGTVYAWGSGVKGEIGDNAYRNRRLPVKVEGLGNVFAISGGGSSSMALYSCVSPSQPVITGITSADNCGRVSISFTSGSPATRHELRVDGISVLSGVSSPVSYRAGDASGHNYLIRAVNGCDSCYVDSEIYAYSTTNNSPSAPVITAVTDTDPALMTGVRITYTAGSPSTGHDLYIDGTLAQGGYVSGEIFQPGDTKFHLFRIRAWNGACDSYSAAILGKDSSRVLPMTTQVWDWGDNLYGQLGNGNNDDSSVPVQVTGVSDISQVSAGQFHSLALKSDGTVRAWGWGEKGQLGVGSYSNSNVPLQVLNISDIVAVSAGGGHSLALTSDGIIWGWGDNNYGQLGVGEFTTKKWLPVQVQNLTGVVAIDAGENYSMALTSDGSVWAWGYNYYGNLGDSTKVNKNLPTRVSNISGALAISAGSGHSMALLQDGTVWSWGNNGQGQLGNETNTQSSIPVQVSNIRDPLGISAGSWHSMALKDDGSAAAWGDNYYGEIGDGGTDDVNYPVGVMDISCIEAISAGDLFSLALENDGTLWSWGYNYDGQLGRGDKLDSHFPIQIPGLFNVLECSAGRGHSMALVRSCETPSIPVISDISDNDPCVQNGITITFTSGTPATRHDLYMDGSLVQAAAASPLNFNPGNTSSHGYVMRAVNGFDGCFTDSAPALFADAVCLPPSSEITETVNTDKSGFSWSATDADNYRVVRGSQADLAGLDNYSEDFSCYKWGASAALSVDISGDDPSGIGGRSFYYLIQGYNGSDPDLLLGPAGNSTAGARKVETPADCD